MAKWTRYNSVIGCEYEIPEREALRRINSGRYLRHYDTDFGRWSNMWQNTKDPWRDIIFKYESGK